MTRRSPRCTRTDTLFPYTTLCRPGRRQFACWAAQPSRPASPARDDELDIAIVIALRRLAARWPSVHGAAQAFRFVQGHRGVGKKPDTDRRLRDRDRAIGHRARPRLTAAQSSRRSCSARSEEHTSELQSLMRISYAVFCLKKNTKTITTP